MRFGPGGGGDEASEGLIASETMERGQGTPGVREAKGQVEEDPRCKRVGKVRGHGQRAGG